MHLYAMKLALLTCLLFCFVLGSSAATLKGKISDENWDALGFATVYVKELNKGTSANADGFYSLELPPGSYTVEFRYVGYQSVVKEIELARAGLTLNVSLKASGHTTKTVTISRRDPAYSIIRKAAKNKKLYATEVELFTAKAYIKGLNQILHFPKKFMGKKVVIEKNDTLSKGVFYLSESVSKLYSKKNEFKEEVIASKVSGEPKGISINNYLMLRHSMYSNIVKVPTSSRGLVSPIADNAALYYRFYLEDTYSDNGIKVHKIYCQPRRTADPAFKGYIYIQDSSWRVHAYDLAAFKNSGLQFIDSLSLKTIYLPVGPAQWAAGMQQIGFGFSLFGFVGSGYYSASLSDYDLKPVFTKNFFKDKVILKADTNIYKNNNTYWDSVRTEPLTTLEQLDYKIQDSLLTAPIDSAKLDSAKKKNNLASYLNPKAFKTKFGTIGYSKPLISFIFNPVEGYTLINTIYFKRNDKTNFSLDPRYGFASHRFYLKGNYYYHNLKNQRWHISGGDYIFQYNEQDPISESTIIDYCLLAHRYLGRLNRKEFFKIQVSDKIARDFNINLSGEIARRRSLSNNSDFGYWPKSKRGTPYETNLPFESLEYVGDYATNSMVLVGGELVYRPNTYSIQHPVIKGSFSNNPTFRLGSRGGLGFGVSAKSNFNRAYLGVNHHLSFGLAGNMDFDVEGGAFLSQHNLPFNDYVHFNGNRTIYPQSNLLGSFLNLPYYKYSTSKQYARANLTHNFGGLLFNKAPGLRKLKLYEIGIANYLYTPKSKQYLELGAGIGNIFKVLTIGYSSSIKQEGPRLQQLWFRFAFKLGS